jgi:hypothetical protein
MADGKVRCPGCGAKNTDALAERCRLCGGLLPDANRRRTAAIGAATGGPAFADLVESEVAAWKEYAEGRSRGVKSRRPEELDNPPKSRFSFRRSKES